MDGGTLQERAHELMGVPRHRVRPTSTHYITVLSTILQLFHVLFFELNRTSIPKKMDKIQMFTFSHMLNFPFLKYNVCVVGKKTS